MRVGRVGFVVNPDSQIVISNEKKKGSRELESIFYMFQNLINNAEYLEYISSQLVEKKKDNTMDVWRR